MSEWDHEPFDHTSDYDPDIPVGESPAHIGDPFAVVWEDGSISSKSAAWYSDSLDMADCDYMEGVKSVHATNENGVLVLATTGKSEALNTDEEHPFRYSRSPVMAGTRIVSYVVHTDH